MTITIEISKEEAGSLLDILFASGRSNRAVHQLAAALTAARYHEANPEPPKEVVIRNLADHTPDTSKTSESEVAGNSVSARPAKKLKAEVNETRQPPTLPKVEDVAKAIKPTTKSSLFRLELEKCLTIANLLHTGESMIDTSSRANVDLKLVKRLAEWLSKCFGVKPSDLNLVSSNELRTSIRQEASGGWLVLPE